MRTASNGSRVGPAVTTTVLPARPGPGQAKRSTSSAITRTSASLPYPTSPHAVVPSSGGTTTYPSSRSVETFRCTSALSHILGFIAGATRRPHSTASATVVKASSARPAASFARTLAVAGATANASAPRAVSKCANARSRAKRSVIVGLLVTASKRRGSTSLVAFGVITVVTSAPSAISRRASSAALYTATLAETPNIIFIGLRASVKDAGVRPQ